MRDYLQAQGVEFDDRNIRHSLKARRELHELTGDLVVPTLMFRGHSLVGFDPEAIDHLLTTPQTASP